jgi:hypothetical protein
MYLLPVSLGEAIDKLSILQIKRENITDERKLDVEKEYSALYEILKEFVVKYAELYESMLKTNRVIWKQMDVLRDGIISDSEYTKLCRECIITNDIRFRIKNKINLISNSELREQKSYKIKRFNIWIEVEGDDLLQFIEPICKLSYIYDEVCIISSKDMSIIRNIFHYDNTIKYIKNDTLASDIHNDTMIEPLPIFYDTRDIYSRLGL